MRRECLVGIAGRKDLPGEQCIEWAGRATSGHLQYMGIDHGRAHVRVAKQFLHGAYVGAGLQQVGCKR